MKYDDIPQFTRAAPYAVDVPWSMLENHLKELRQDYKLDLNPDFQRGHVWTSRQQERFVEFCLRGGSSANNIYLNCPGWQHGGGPTGELVLVDGKQRLEAVCAFLRNEVKAFGYLRREFKDKMPFIRFRMNVNDLETRAQVLQWYLDMNDGGIAHSEKELSKVRTMLEAENGKR